MQCLICESCERPGVPGETSVNIPRSKHRESEIKGRLTSLSKKNVDRRRLSKAKCHPNYSELLSLEFEK